jgi:hypothetical protein
MIVAEPVAALITATPLCLLSTLSCRTTTHRTVSFDPSLPEDAGGNFGF